MQYYGTESKDAHADAANESFISGVVIHADVDRVEVDAALEERG